MLLAGPKLKLSPAGRSVQFAHALLSLPRSVHALCSETYSRILFGRIPLGHTRLVMLVSVHTVVQS